MMTSLLICTHSGIYSAVMIIYNTHTLFSVLLSGKDNIIATHSDPVLHLLLGWATPSTHTIRLMYAKPIKSVVYKIVFENFIFSFVYYSGLMGSYELEKTKFFSYVYDIFTSGVQTLYDMF